MWVKIGWNYGQIKEEMDRLNFKKKKILCEMAQKSNDLTLNEPEEKKIGADKKHVEKSIFSIGFECC